MTTNTMTARQAQDFRNGYSEGYSEARHGETSVDGWSPSVEHAAGEAAGLRDGRTSGPGRSAADLTAAIGAWVLAWLDQPPRPEGE